MFIPISENDIRYFQNLIVKTAIDLDTDTSFLVILAGNVMQKHDCVNCELCPNCWAGIQMYSNDIKKNALCIKNNQ